MAWIWIGGAIALLGALIARVALARGAPAPRALRSTRPGSAGAARARSTVEYALALSCSSALVAVAVVAPAARVAARRSAGGELALEELEAAKEAKYREIRDAELDHQMGKLSARATGARVDRELRAEAIEILRELDRLEGRSPDGGMDR